MCEAASAGPPTGADLAWRSFAVSALTERQGSFAIVTWSFSFDVRAMTLA